MDNERRFAQAVGVLGETFGRQVTPATIMAYKMGLGDIPIDELERAVAVAVNRCKFMPVPAELRELAGRVEISLPDRAAKAWAAVESALQEHGYYHSVDFDDPAINAAIRSLGGWMRLSEVPRQERLSYYRRDFLQAYQAFCRAGISGDAAAPLCGYFEQGNRGTRHEHHPSAIASSRPRRIATGLPLLPRLCPPRLPPIARLTGEIAPDACKLPEDR